MARTTTTAIQRSTMGGKKGTVSAAPGICVARFYIADPTAANTTAVDVDSSNGDDVVLPANAIILRIDASADATGGTNPTFDLGWIEVDDATTFDVDGLIAEGDADAGDSVFDHSTATAGDDFDLDVVTDKAFRITGGVGASAATGGTINGVIWYTVQDDMRDSV